MTATNTLHDTVTALLLSWRADIQNMPPPLMPALDAALALRYRNREILTALNVPRPRAALG